MDEIHSGSLMVKSLKGKTLCGLSYPRSMVREPTLICGIMRLMPVNLLVKLSYMDSACHAISGGMWNVT
jgi:hypothetical protein